MRTLLKSSALALALMTSSAVMAKTENYKIDPTHSFVQFKASHLGFSWLFGRFNDVKGELVFDSEDISKSQVSVTIDTNSLDSNHAKRDKHLKSDDYIDASKFPEATFKSTKVSQKGEDIMISGELNFRSISKTLDIKAQLIGAGDDPWGGNRRGYQGIATFDMTDFGMKGKAGTARSQIELRLFIEAIKKK